MIYLRFSTNKWSLVSALIRWRTESKVSHVELYDSLTGQTLGARFSLRGKIAQRLYGFQEWDGVQIRTAHENRKQSGIVLVTVPWGQEAWDWISAKNVGNPYDWRGIWGIVSSHGECDKNACFCSEVIVKFLVATNRWTYNLSPQATTPRDLFVIYGAK